MSFASGTIVGCRMKFGASSPVGHEVGLPVLYLFNIVKQKRDIHNDNASAAPFFTLAALAEKELPKQIQKYKAGKDEINCCTLSIRILFIILPQLSIH